MKLKTTDGTHIRLLIDSASTVLSRLYSKLMCTHSQNYHTSADAKKFDLTKMALLQKCKGQIAFLFGLE